MKKRNLSSIILLYIFSLVLVFSCKTEQSLPSSLIEKQGNNCFYIYSKYDTSVQQYPIPISHYCITECKQCPSEKDISNFNATIQGEIYLSNTLCPLNKNNTVYTTKTSEFFNNYIQGYRNNTLTLNVLDQNQDTFKSTIQSSGNGDLKNVGILKNDDIENKCSRDLPSLQTSKTVSKTQPSTINTVIKNLVTNNDPIMKNFMVGVCDKIPVLAHMNKQGQINTIFRVDITKETNFDNVVFYIPPEYRLPNHSECSPQTLSAISIFLKDYFKEEEYLQKEYDRSSKKQIRDRFWIHPNNSSCAIQDQQSTCMYDGTQSCSQPELYFTHLVLVREQLNGCILIPYNIYKAFRDMPLNK